VPAALARLTLSVPFNDLDAVRTVFAQHGDDIACVIVEPIIGNSGFIPPRPDFHAELREITTRHGALLIFDEVMTGFRVALGGAQELYDVTPDLTTLGKVIGGGLPVGAYGGRRDLMEQVAPSGPVYQAGTLSGNPLAMAAGVSQLLFLRESMPYTALEQRARRLIDGLGEVAEQCGVPFWGDARGAMFGWHFVGGPVRDFSDAARADAALFQRFFLAALQRGVFLPASPFEAAFISTAHGDDIVDESLQRLSDALREATS
jgi:glutamate-1-semialdehyde 2,1-aminomutase